jgi:ubiquinone/menaquinone biosynthesis C-methylase UbiE
MIQLLTQREIETVDWYDKNGKKWADERKKIGEPSFWDEEYRQFLSLKKPEGRLLEIGSGSGREAREWIQMGYSYTGIELSSTLIDIAQKTAPLGIYVQTSVYEMPFIESSFDAFSSWAMLPHIPKEKIGLGLSCIRRVLKRGALGFLAMREGEGEKREPENGRWFSYYRQDEFGIILKKCGFEIVSQGRKPSRPDLTWLTFIVRN